uniref:C2 domain-containing protein n=1 Tax=Macrostomum lignano TaxID=282301 RepID=A0A1I8FIC1_9PLAT
MWGLCSWLAAAAIRSTITQRGLGSAGHSFSVPAALQRAAASYYQHHYESGGGDVRQPGQQPPSLEAELLGDSRCYSIPGEATGCWTRDDRRDKSNRGPPARVDAERKRRSQSDEKTASQRPLLVQLWRRSGRGGRRLAVRTGLPAAVCSGHLCLAASATCLRAEIGEGDEVVEWNGYLLGRAGRGAAQGAGHRLGGRRIRSCRQNRGSTTVQQQTARHNSFPDGQRSTLPASLGQSTALLGGGLGRLRPTSPARLCRQVRLATRRRPKRSSLAAAEFPFERFAAGSRGADPFAPPPTSGEQFQYDTAGEISVQLHFDDYDSSLTVHIARARGLPPMDLNGLADPFVKVRLMPDPTDRLSRDGSVRTCSARSSTCLTRLEPDWQQTVVFMDVPTELKSTGWTFSVWDYDAAQRLTTLWGAASSAGPQADGQSAALVHALRPRERRCRSANAAVQFVGAVSRRPHRVGGNDSQKCWAQAREGL